MKQICAAVAVLWCCAAGAAVWAEDVAAPPIPPELQPLVAHLDDKNVYERQKAFLRLEATREPSLIPAFRAHLASRDWHTRAFAVRALAAVEGAPAIPVLLEKAAHDRQSDVRLAALLGLEPLRDRDPAIEATFRKALRDRTPEVRMAAADIVSRSPSEDAKAAIRKRWKREWNRDVRRVLADAMKRIGERE